MIAASSWRKTNVCHNTCISRNVPLLPSPNRHVFLEMFHCCRHQTDCKQPTQRLSSRHWQHHNPTYLWGLCHLSAVIDEAALKHLRVVVTFVWWHCHIIWQLCFIVNEVTTTLKNTACPVHSCKNKAAQHMHTQEEEDHDPNVDQ